MGLGGCHVEEGGQGRQADRLGGEEGVPGDCSGRKGLLPAKAPQLCSTVQPYGL